MNRLILRSLVTALLLLVFLSVPSTASADSILWTLTGVPFTPVAGTSGMAGTATGSFDFDGTTFSNIDIKTFNTTPTGPVLLNEYKTLSAGPFNDSVISLFLGASSGDLSKTPLLALFFEMPGLVNSGGTATAHLTTGADMGGGEGSCTASDCSSSAEDRFISGGAATSTVAVPTPEPSALSLLSVALAALLAGVAIRKASQA